MQKRTKSLIAMCALKSFKLLLFFAFASSLQANDGLEKLKAGNKRYLNDTLEHCLKVNKNRIATAESQAPLAIILGCADSRVPPEIVFDQTIGDLFTVRVAGNVVGPLELDSIEYGAIVLGAQTLLVLGHENCGAVQAVLAGKAQDFEAVDAKISPHLKGLKPPVSLEEAVKANVKAVAQGLKESPVLSGLIKQGKLEVTCGYYHFTTGEVEFFVP